MTRTVTIRRPMARGNTTQLRRASVLSEENGMLRVVMEGEKKPIIVKASEVQDLRVVVHSSLPDSPNSLTRILEKRGF